MCLTFSFSGHLCPSSPQYGSGWVQNRVRTHPRNAGTPELFILRGLSASLSPSSPVVCHPPPANAHTLCMGSWVLRALLVLSLAGLLSRSSTSVPARAHLGLQRQHVASPGDPWGLSPAPTPRLSMLGCQWTWSSWLLMNPLSCPRVVRLEDRDWEPGFQPALRGR